MLIISSRFLGITILTMGLSIGKIVHADPAVQVPYRSSNDLSGSRAAKQPRQELSQTKGFEEPTGTISLAQALSLALMKNPQLAAFSWEVRIAEAERLQAGLIPNPELETEVEDFGGSGERRDFRSSETTVRLTQVIELGGKRGKRTTVANLKTQLAGWDFKAKRLGVVAETAKAFLHVEAAQERLSLSESLFSLTNQVSNVVQNSIAAGRVSPLDGARAKIQVTTSKINLGRAKRDLQVARQNLASAWGSTNPRFSLVKGNFGLVTPIPALGQLLQEMAGNPELARSKSEINLRTSELALERSENIPDLSVSVGAKRLEEVNDTVFLIGVSIPIPVFGVNRGGIIGAGHKLSQSQQKYRAVELQITTELRVAYNNLSSSNRETVALANSVIPAAQKVFNATQRGYQNGKIGLLQVLDAQRTLFEARGRYIDAAETYHLAKIEVERLIGGPTKALTPLMEKKQ